MTNLLDVLKEQAAFGFTGKINVLLLSNDQYLGAVYQQEGMMVGAQYGQLKGKRALLKIIFDDVETVVNLKFVVEPELIQPEFCSIKMDYEQVKKEAGDIYQKFIQAKKLKPSLSMRLVIDPKIIQGKEQITSEEFDLLSTLTEYNVVSDLYQNSNLLEFEITNALISLRKKRAIKVFQN